jgi:hypothetical protein
VVASSSLVLTYCLYCAKHCRCNVLPILAESPKNLRCILQLFSCLLYRFHTLPAVPCYHPYTALTSCGTLHMYHRSSSDLGLSQLRLTS